MNKGAEVVFILLQDIFKLSFAFVYIAKSELSQPHQVVTIQLVSRL